ncbi:hypothetical protein BDE02_18G102700 [Populus trichocarpa]|nr:hypothetical protein BDE02_18G102700 [Populus trichocarpa]
MSCTFSCLAAASGVPIPLRLIFLFSTAFNLCKLGDHIFFFNCATISHKQIPT